MTRIQIETPLKLILTRFKEFYKSLKTQISKINECRSYGEGMVNHPVCGSSPHWLARKEEDGQWEGRNFPFTLESFHSFRCNAICFMDKIYKFCHLLLEIQYL